MDAATAAIYGMSAQGITIALVGVAKKAGLPTKWAPVASMGIGVVAGVAAAYSMGEPLLAGIAAGVLLGASACGVYDLGKTVTNDTTEEASAEAETPAV